MERISLNKRLEISSTNKADFLGVFKLCLDEYFKGLAGNFRDSYYINLYENVISNEFPLNGELLSMACLPKTLEDFPFTYKENMDFLFKILVEPFAKTYENIKEENI